MTQPSMKAEVRQALAAAALRNAHSHTFAEQEKHQGAQPWAPSCAEPWVLA
jgi:hypothetical protein